ncbi:SAF domain-containing protein [Actinomyces gerencseriae]|uniref:SAF domain-containing protein n=1 Tax=Actinomyces gerencseriae TaxID=52769 RepID=UPI00040BDEC6|nr:SAF domain-containing protein [Actinomyces gerencseriae]
MIALCLGAAAALALGVLRPGPQPGREVVVVARTIGAGSVITADDLTTRALPPDALPAAGLAGPEVVGSRAAIGLEEGTVLTVSMTSAALAADVGADERLVQVPVEVGAQLAEPGAHVDVIGEATGREASQENDESADANGIEAFRGSPGTAVLCRNARVILSTPDGEDSGWTVGTKVTLVTLAVPAANASLIVSAATNGALGVVLSP